MKKSCKCALHDYLTDCITNDCKHEKSAQTSFHRKLLADLRSPSSGKHGEGLCCTLRFIIYLCFFCSDVNKLISDLREIILRIYGDDSQDS